MALKSRSLQTTSFSLPPFVSRRGLFDTNQRLSLSYAAPVYVTSRNLETKVLSEANAMLKCRFGSVLLTPTEAQNVISGP